MLKKTLMMLSMISILVGPFIYLSIVQNMGNGGVGLSFKMPKFGVPDWLESGSEQVMTATDMGGNRDGGTTVYKWKDAAGVWQFTNELPAGVKDVETMQVTPGTTVQAFKPQAEPEADAPAQARQDEALELDLVPTPGRVKQLIDDANNVQTMLDERARQMDALSSE